MMPLSSKVLIQLENKHYEKYQNRICSYCAVSTLFAAEPATQPASSTKVATVQHVGISSAYDVEAGSNIAPGSQNTGRSMDDAFNVHTLVAGEWY